MNSGLRQASASSLEGETILAPSDGGGPPKVCCPKRPEDRFADAESLEQALSECAAAEQWTEAEAGRWWREHDESRAAAREMSAATTG